MICFGTRIPIHKAILPLAGIGTRLFPATKVLSKAFFPIIDYDGFIKPALLVILEELVDAGIEEIALVVQPGQEVVHNRLFVKDTSIQYSDRLPKEKRKYNEIIREIGKKITYLYQTKQLGFGHAVYQAKNFAENEPVLLTLGDHLYHSESNDSCTRQLLKTYEKTGGMTISLDEVTLEQVKYYGILKGKSTDIEQRTMNVDAIVEKPTAEYAKKFLGVKDEHGCSHYYCVFGQYVLTPSVFQILDRNIQTFNGIGEIELTSVLNEVREKDGMYAYRVDGKRFDIGIPEEYRKTLLTFGK